MCHCAILVREIRGILPVSRREQNVMVYAQHRIWIGLVWPTPDPQKMTGSGDDTDPEYRIDASLIKTVTIKKKTTSYCNSILQFIVILFAY